MRIVWGLVWGIIGFGIIKYTFQIVQTFGTIGWAENHLGGGMGGTYTMWKIIGVAVICLAFMYMFGLFDNLLGPLAPVFTGAPPE